MENRNSKFFENSGLLRTLAKNSFKAIDNGFYDMDFEIDYSNHNVINFRKKINECHHAPLITEIKLSSPSKGNLIKKKENVDINHIAKTMEYCGSIGISILAQPYLFDGSIENIVKVRRTTTLPILMKDIIVSDIQIKAAKKAGADAILLIKTVFDKDLTEGSLDKMLEYAKRLELQVIIETHHIEEFKDIIQINKKISSNSNRGDFSKKFDIIGINNRNLDTLKINLDTTKEILSKVDKSENIILSESGIYNQADILFLKNSGADVFLVGSSLMENIDTLDKKIKELVYSY